MHKIAESPKAITARVVRARVSATIREIRTALGLSQENFAKAMGVSRLDVVRLENEGSKATSHRLRAALARGIGIGIADANALVDGDITVRQALSRRRRMTGS